MARRTAESMEDSLDDRVDAGVFNVGREVASCCRAAIVWLAVLVLAAGERSSAEETPDAEQVRFFESAVRPVLADNCFRCHGERKQKGKLRLDSLASMLRGGESGPAIVPGEPDESLLVEAINHQSFEMPPKGKLEAKQIVALTRWIELGAPWPGADRSTPLPADSISGISDEDRAFWSFQPLADPALPQTADAGWARNPIDRFVFSRLASARLKPAPEADRGVLIRRATFDLIGLPPTPEKVAGFLTDQSSGAYEELVDRLLASPRYGERWGRHWLDLVRYAESDGYRADFYRPQAWRYRDYVIRSFNDDKPYDRFVVEQIAGDEVAPEDPDVLVATGYLRHWIYEWNQRDVRTQWNDILNDLTDVTGDVFLGLGMGCARCHDHKFDPIPQKDYYALQAFFAPIAPREDLLLATPAELIRHCQRTAEWEEKVAPIQAKIAEIERPIREKLAEGAIVMFPDDVEAMIRKPAQYRRPLEHQLAELAYRQVHEAWKKVGAGIKGDAKERRKALEEQLAEFDAYRPEPLALGLVVTDVGPHAPPTVIPGRRDGAAIEPAFLTVLGGQRATPTPIRGVSTGRRTELAKWLTRPDHALTTRVIVNRVWQHHFGVGLVATTSDFGRLGDRPSHPELLDWLARRFVRDGWSVKRLHRLIMTSAVYRQSATEPASDLARRVDPANRLLWRMNLRRLDAEQTRDAMLSVSGELDRRIGGPSAEWSAPRRSVYAKVLRNKHDAMLEAFDAPDGFASCARRNVTTTASQALLMINGPWTNERAVAFARRIERSAPDADRGAQVDLAYRLSLGRAPSAAERAGAVEFLGRQARIADRSGAKEQGLDEPLVDLCHVLLNANEFLYVD